MPPRRKVTNSKSPALDLWPSKPKIKTLKAPFILFHGGLGDARPEKAAAFLKSLQEIAEKLQIFLKKYGQKEALDLAIAAVNELENNPLFNAGFGARLQSDGVARLSAAVMKGAEQKLAAVSNLQAIKNPSLVAKALLQESDRTLSSLEANRYAFSKGFKPELLVTEERLSEWRKKRVGKTGTVGAVALDANKKTAACTSTGGKGHEIPGRVSDSFTPAGNFANPYGAVSCTGVGEDILEAAVASSIGARLEDKVPLSDAIKRSLKAHTHRHFGLIALSAKGESCVHATSGNLAFGLVSRDQLWVGIHASQWINASTGVYRPS